MEERGPLHTIGEFADLTGLTEKALRIYDSKSLLKPVAVDPQSGYRYYDAEQVGEGRLIAMMRAINMPLAEIEVILEAPPADRPSLLGKYWYRIERDLDDHRRTVRSIRDLVEKKEYGVSLKEQLIEVGTTEGAFAAIRAIADVTDPIEASSQYGEVMKAAYWERHDMGLVTALAYAGADRLLAAASTARPETAFELRCAAKALMYDLASFNWMGWDEPGIHITEADANAGLAAARANLSMAIELERGDLAISRAYWMLGAHHLTSGNWTDAGQGLERAREFAVSAGAQAEVELCSAFRVVVDMARGKIDSRAELDLILERLEKIDGGAEFVEQVETVLAVVSRIDAD